MLLPELIALDDYRVRHDWSWRELAIDMTRAGVDCSPRTLHYLVKVAPPRARPLDRTLYKIRVYLKFVQKAQRRRANARRRARKATETDTATV